METSFSLGIPPLRQSVVLWPWAYTSSNRKETLKGFRMRKELLEYHLNIWVSQVHCPLTCSSQLAYSNILTCDVVHGVKWSRVVHVHSEQQHKTDHQCNQQIDRCSKGPVSTQDEMFELTDHKTHRVVRVFPEAHCFIYQSREGTCYWITTIWS